MTNTIKLGIITLAAIIGFTMIACSNGGPTGDTNQTPVASDYTFGNLSQTAGSVTPVTITPKQGKSPGARTIYYEGTGGTAYAKNTTHPQTAGTYAVTFDVEAATDWNAASDLSASNLVVSPSSTFAISFDEIVDVAPIIVDKTISLSGENKTAIITLENHGDYTSIAWNVTGTDASGSGESFTLNSANPEYNSVGKYFLTVEVLKDGIPYNKTIVFTVTE
jgi:hypothetical protein